MSNIMILILIFVGYLFVAGMVTVLLIKFWDSSDNFGSMLLSLFWPIFPLGIPFLIGYFIFFLLIDPKNKRGDK